MFRLKKNLKLVVAQTIVEYTFLLGIIFAIFMALSPMIRRTSQGMVKIMADQVGLQINSEQIGGKAGKLINMTIDSKRSDSKTKAEDFGTTTYVIDRSQDTKTATYSNVGFIEKPIY